MKLFLLLTFATFVCGGRINNEFHIVGLFYNDSKESERAFASRIALTGEFDVEKSYKGFIHNISNTNVYSVTQLLCNLTASNIGLTGVFSPGKPGTNAIIQSITANLEIPYMHVSWTPMVNPTSVTHLNFFPDSDLYVKGLGIIVDHLMWNSFVVLYENNEGLIRLQDALKIKNYSENKRMTTITLKRLGPGPDYRGILKELKNTSDVNILLDCKTENVLPIMLQAKEMKRLDHFHNYFITALDAHTLDYSILDTMANITTIRIIDPNDPNLVRAAEHWTQLERISRKFNNPINPKKVKAEEALTYDALNLFFEAIRKLHVTQPIKSQPLSCQGNDKWPDGFRIVSYMKQLEQKNAITGPMSFDNLGNRIDFVLQLVERKNDNFNVVAKWSPSLGDNLNYTRSDVENLQQIEEDLQKMKVIVASRIGAPYLRMAPVNDSADPPKGNDRYEGYSMDLIKAIAGRLNFTFEFVIVKEYGKYDPQTKQWTGLIKELLDRRAHLAICDLTITYERQEVVDFSSPFMSLGISILYKKSTKEPPSLLQFMAPFSFDVWMYTATIYLGVSIMLYFIARMAPGDWENPHPCDQNPEELENIWTLKNCMWLNLGSLMTQGCDILPKGISSRMMTSMWWFFAIIMANSYMANLAAFLTADKMDETIDSVEELAKQTKIKYGTLEGGSTEAFFRNSNFSTYQRMWTQMLSSKPRVFEKTNADGVNRVKTTKNNLYAFLMESSSIEYEVHKNCDLKQVGTWLDNKNYGIAMPMNSRYRSSINRAILELAEQGELKKLKKKWWGDEKNKKTCQEVDDTNKSGKLALENVGGVFLVLGVGISVALLLATVEFLWNVRDISVDEHVSYWEALKHELKFTFNIWEVKKKAKIQLSESSSSKSNIADTRSIAEEILHGASSFLNINALNRIGLMNTQKDD